MTLDTLETVCINLKKSHPAWKLGVFKQIRAMLKWFAGKQIRKTIQNLLYINMIYNFKKPLLPHQSIGIYETNSSTKLSQLVSIEM